jgi:hypothetical protein
LAVWLIKTHRFPSDKNKNVARVGHPALLKTRTKEVGFSVLGGSTATLLESLEAGAAGGILAFASCAPQACQEVYLAWKDRDFKLAAEKQQRIAGREPADCGPVGHERREVRLRLQRLLRRPDPRAAAWR